MRKSTYKSNRSVIVAVCLFAAAAAAVLYSLDIPLHRKSSSSIITIAHVEPPVTSREMISLHQFKKRANDNNEVAVKQTTSYASVIKPHFSQSANSFDDLRKAHDSCVRSGASSAHNFFKANALSFVGTSESKIWEIWGNSVKKSILSSPTLVLDVGANVGQSGFRFLDIFPQTIVHSFEPGTSSMESLKSLNASLPFSKSSRWRAHLNAMSSTEGELSFSDANTGDSQTATLGSSSKIGLKHNRIVKVSTVDFFLSLLAEEVGEVPFVDLLKIDVEGWECDVMAGASASLGAVPPRIGAIYFEYGSTWFDERHGPAVPKVDPLIEITKDLSKKGYECYLSGVTDLIFIGPAIAQDKNSILYGDISGYGPNVLCLHRDILASKTLFTEHPKSIELCKWW